MQVSASKGLFDLKSQIESLSYDMVVSQISCDSTTLDSWVIKSLIAILDILDHKLDFTICMI
jgi:hypothetical protein